ncbi:UNVERIFIED_CONTAM: Thaumatin-like protein 1 [Sesamum calycinum]|uniref:Thaumatin-like protein 1 n=1 Tax=Sesamum calycinum TaxID=2727403 RepID=A0AAW2SU54_9LAMI
MGSSYAAVLIILLHIFQSKGVGGATFTFVNKCSQTIWPAILGSPRLESTGFELPKGASRAFQAPTGWSGRFWGRTGCTFDGSGHGSCATGDCGSGQMECNGAGATAATLAEFTLGTGSMDFYDVSLVDGYNLPLMVDVRGGSGQCASTGCLEDLNQRCPAELRTEGGGACRSACDAFNTPEYCCKGEYGSPSTCKPSMYSQLFKNACPKSYSYAYDDATSTFTCTAADYVITFCPSLPSQKSSKPDDATADGSVSGSGSSSKPESEPGSGSGSVQEAILADGSWLADLATGDSSRTHSFSAVALMILIVHLARVVVP